MRSLMVFVAGTAIACSCASSVTAKTVAPTVDGSVRDMDIYGAKDGMADSVLDGGAVQIVNAPSMEDRGIIEFSLSGVSGSISSAQLFLPVFASNGPFPFGINVFAYAGDGNLTPSDWTAGSVFTSFTFSGDEAVALDVTSFVSSALALGYSHAGFNLQCSLPSSIIDNGPYLAFGSFDCKPSTSLSITEVPEPSDLFLTLLGIFGLLAYCYFRHMRFLTRASVRSP